ncbi:MAG: hypothetical protein EA421_14155 [Gemmatimonadales bacterium]|nr:MAG: hypothetical protein EA421_14155 [Gemmatimonadales bacterium]
MKGLEDRRVSPSHRPRLLVAAGEGTLRQDLRGALTGKFDLLDELPRGEGVAGAVLGFTCIREPETRQRIRAVREAIRPAPSVLVTSNRTENLLSLSALVVERVHPLEEGLESLPDVVGTMLDVDRLATLARRVEVCEAMDPAVRRSMVLILRSRPPMGSVKRLCRELGMGRSTLHDHWSVNTDHAPSSVTDVLRLVALYRAGTLMDAGYSVLEAADRVGWSRRRLETSARSLLCADLADLGLELPRLLGELEDIARRLGPRSGGPDNSGLPPDTSVLVVPK